MMCVRVCVCHTGECGVGDWWDQIEPNDFVRKRQSEQ